MCLTDVQPKAEQLWLERKGEDAREDWFEALNIVGSEVLVETEFAVRRRLVWVNAWFLNRICQIDRLEESTKH